MEYDDDAIVLTLLPHGEHGAIVRFLSMAGGLRAGFVHGARSARRRAVLHPGNRVALHLQARNEGQLPVATVELVESRALAAFAAHSAAILAWATELTAAALAEAVPHRRLAEALDALCAGLAAEIAPVQAGAALARYELLVLEEEGFGLDLGSCALGGPEPPAFVSPNSGRGVSAAKAAGQPWAHHLLPLPPFLLNGQSPDTIDVARALALSRHFLARHWLNGPRLETLRQLAVGSTVRNG